MGCAGVVALVKNKNNQPCHFPLLEWQKIKATGQLLNIASLPHSPFEWQNSKRTVALWVDGGAGVVAWCKKISQALSPFPLLEWEIMLIQIVGLPTFHLPE